MFLGICLEPTNAPCGIWNLIPESLPMMNQPREAMQLAQRKAWDLGPCRAFSNCIDGLNDGRRGQLFLRGAAAPPSKGLRELQLNIAFSMFTSELLYFTLMF